MRIPSSAHAALALALTSRQSGNQTLDVGVWAPPGPNDIRSPCPGLNTLANHGYLPRDGRHVRIFDIITAMDTQLGIASDFGLVQVAGAAVRGAFSFLPDGSLGLDSLDVLTKSHNNIEHDASFTRDDLAFGSNVIKNTTQIEQLLAHSTDGVTLTVEEIADARHIRLKDSFTRNPNVTLEKKQTDACWREGALISLVVGDDSGNVRVDWLREWFINERLPTSLGWKAASPAHGIIENLHYTSIYENYEKQRNAVDDLPLEFGILPF